MLPLRLSAFAFLGFTAFNALACGGDGDESADVATEEVRAPVDRDTTPDVSAGEAESIARDGRAFAFDLYGRARDDARLAGRNVFLSPFSVSYALAMTSAGAGGATLDEMRQALRLSLPQERVHPALNGLSLALAALPGQAAEAAAAARRPNDRLELSLVNQVWAQRGMRFGATFLETLATDYGAGVKLADFAAAHEEARADINGWVEEATGDRIRELLPANSLDGATRVVLVNAVALSAPWQTPFDAKFTADGAFTRLDGTQATVPMMRNVDPAPYAADDDVEVTALPLLGGRLSLVLALPKPGAFERVDASFGRERFESLVAALAPRALSLSLPKFRLNAASVSLKPHLEALGMRAAFAPAADFSGITTDEPVYVGDVLHQAMLGFDENGIEAAAATAAVGKAGSAPQAPHPFAVDRPFFAGVRDAQTGALLFWGRIVDPTADDRQ